MKNLKKITKLAVLMVCMLVNQGCFALFLGAAAGAGGITYVKGKLEKNLDNPVKEIYSASLSAIKDMKLFIIEDNITEHEAFIKFEYSDGEKGQVSINALTERSSKVVVRVGILGDQVKSQAMLTAIENNL